MAWAREPGDAGAPLVGALALTVTAWQHLTEEIQEEEVWQEEYSEPNTFLV